MKKLSEILARILAAPDPIAELERALSEIEAARAAVKDELEGLAVARDVALADWDDSALAALRQRRPTLEDERDRLAIAIDAVRQKLAEAHAAKTQARVAELRAAHDAATRGYIKAAEPALAAFEAILMIRADGIREGFASAIASMELPPVVGTSAVLSRDAFEAYSRNIAGVTSRPKLAQMKPKPVTVKPAVVERRAAPVPVPARRAPIRDTAKEGETLVVALRAGAELPGRGALAVGDQVSLSHDDAATLLRAGVVDLVVAASQPIINAEHQECIS